MPQLSDDERERLVALFEITQRAVREDADEHTRNEGINATGPLFRLLAKHGLSLTDMPELQRQQEMKKAGATSGAPAGAATPAGDQPNVLEIVHHILPEWSDVQPHEYVGIALWTLAAHVFDKFEVSPRLALLSPVRGCGKTNLLKVIERLTPNAARYSSITAATLYRVIDEGMGTLLLDEGDNLGLKMDRVMRQVLNDGYERGGRIGRSPGGIRREYSIFAPVAIAAIGTLTLPLMQRSIVIQMQRSKRDDLKTKEQLASPVETQRLDAIRRLIDVWAQSVTAFNKAPKLPKLLAAGRPADNWRVLISIADSFGSEHWSKAAREAAEVFAGGYHDEDAPVALLSDIRKIFVRLRVDRIKSLELTQELHALEDGMGVWSAWCGDHDDAAPHAISQGEIAMLLRRFDRVKLRPKPLFDLGSRNSRGVAGRGYYKSQFEPWWAMYCTDHGEPAEVRQLRPDAKSKTKSKK